MKQRTITAVIMALILVPILILGGWFFNTLAMILAYVGTYELINMHSTKNNIPRITKYVLPIFSSMIVLCGCLFSQNDLIYVFLVEVALLLLLPIFNKNFKMTDIMFIIFSIIYSGVTFYLFTKIRNLENFNYNKELFGLNIYMYGLILVIFMLVTTMATDIFAYIFGCKFGKHKLCPTISPKKSVEGAIAGTVLGSVFGIVVLLVLVNVFKNPEIIIPVVDNKTWEWVLAFGVAVLLSIAGQLGDLIASKIKREYEIKDYGNLFPGHGGVLDRFDSSIFASLVFYIILMISGLF